MRAAHAIRDKRLPLIGVCSDANTSACGLRSIGMLGPDQSNIQSLLDTLEDEDAEYQYRTRLEVRIKRYAQETHEEEQTLYALNEALVSDKHPTEASWSELRVDEEHTLQQFQNRGILVSSGTGSSGWLASALWKTKKDVRELVERVKAAEFKEQDAFNAAYDYNQEIQMSKDSSLMKFHVREPNPISRPDERTGLAEKEVKIKSESLNPTLFIDSFQEVPLGCEDEVSIRVNRDMDIKVLRFAEI